ncbi:MAG: RusA family crossover junction endodeoxyribonuclease [Berryella intestinalis]|uniref:RusA family crossover junction endodeoxyribonuclease n=1 Tax=Berryella intestinalis TaxID=1531429 RepID=UPI002A7636F6|nr:RusA family crossover junction endodeoxyribonuclease [Berryella intestinalis]MDY3128682.1 RusA family crossover junction endodeoxyribonuclease [Berryella intestinalis]
MMLVERGSLRVPIIPVKRRARFDRRGRMYTDAATRADMAAIARKFEMMRLPKVERGFPVFVRVDVYGRLPKGTPKKKTALPFVQRPDIDNIGKAVLDALNGLAWHDDSQIALLTVEKHRRERREPHTEITYGVIDYDR